MNTVLGALAGVGVLHAMEQEDRNWTPKQVAALVVGGAAGTLGGHAANVYLGWGPLAGWLSSKGLSAFLPEFMGAAVGVGVMGYVTYLALQNRGVVDKQVALAVAGVKKKANISNIPQEEKLVVAQFNAAFNHLKKMVNPKFLVPAVVVGGAMKLFSLDPIELGHQGLRALFASTISSHVATSLGASGPSKQLLSSTLIPVAMAVIPLYMTLVAGGAGFAYLRKFGPDAAQEPVRVGLFAPVGSASGLNPEQEKDLLAKLGSTVKAIQGAGSSAGAAAASAVSSFRDAGGSNPVRDDSILHS